MTRGLVDHSFSTRVRTALEQRGWYQTDLVEAIKGFGLKRPLSGRHLKRILSGKYHNYSQRAKAQILRALPELR